ncbi:MAG TPA: ABC-2 transporter permease [Candidatus Fimivivens faecavium]|nr:ABC-2 transporter permease [Candidatus Fimivivens faecavium]
MKGLLIKELRNILRYAKTLLILLVFYAALSFTWGGGQGSFLGGMIVMLVLIMSITSFSYDDLCKWDRYALTLPLTRREIVRSKYLFAMILLGAGLLLSLAAGVGFSLAGGGEDLVETLASTAGSLIAALFLTSVMIPLIYRFGTEKSRLMLFAVAVLPTAALFLLYQSGVTITEQALKAALIAAVPVSVVLFYLSYRVSAAIYERKEF